MNDNKEEINQNQPIRVGISIGDTNGIGAEVVIKALRNKDMLLNCIPIIYASTKFLAFTKKELQDDLFVYQGIEDASKAIKGKISVINAWKEAMEIEFGRPTQESGKYAFQSLEKATQDLASNKIDVLVTAPISKEAIHKAGFKFPGHTEYLADLSNKNEALMMMVSQNLRVALVSSHVSLKEAIESLSEEKIMQKAEELNTSLKKDFGIVRPRIAILGLNPHAGEKGAMGSEESEIITPAINQLMKKGILAFGPYPADGFFGSRQYAQFDAVLAMYHDQGLTGFKSIAFDDGVNFTAGLPIVRTSPDHGTAFDIAGKGVANEQSFRSAIYLAMDIYKTRKFIKEINKNPLQPQKMKKEH